MQLNKSTAAKLLAAGLAIFALPAEVTGPVVTFLQLASADIAAVLFRLAGIPFTRDGVVFSFQAFDVEVARQCSGIRSASATLGCAILLGQLFLRRSWARWVFALLVIPIVIFKNAVRITVITWLGLYWDQGFMTGDLHHYSGVPFALLTAGLLLPAFWVLRRFDAGISSRDPQPLI